MNDLPPEVRQFIAAHIGSVAQLELLLLFRERSAEVFNVEQVCRLLYTAVEPTAQQMAELASSGLLTPVDSNGLRLYQYRPASDDLGRLVDELVRLYRERRIAVTSAIYADASDKFQRFADAFRLRKEK